MQDSVIAVRSLGGVSETVREQKPGGFVYDLDRKISGVIRLKVKGKFSDGLAAPP